MALARCNLVVQDEAGNIVDGASVEVRRETPGQQLVQLYSDRDGASPLGNPFTAADGRDAGFHAVGGAYKIVATLGGFSMTRRYEPVGTAAENDSDAVKAGLLLNWDTGTSDANPGSGLMRANNASLASAATLYISKTSRGGSDISAFLAALDDSSNTVKGVLILTDPDEAQATFRVGAVTDASGYIKLAVSGHSGATSFADDDAISFQFTRAGDAGSYAPGGTDVAVADGGTGASDTSGARTNLGLAYGKQSIWVPATAMIPRTTNGPAIGTLEMSSNKNMVATLDFDATTQEFAQFDIRMPKSWNEGTVTFIPVWSHATTTTNFGVVWGLDAVAISDDDTLDVAFGTAQTSTDTGGTTNDCYQGPESSAITVAGTPAAGDLVQFRIHRNPSDGSDTLAVDARLHGVLVLYTNDNTNDT